MLTVKWPGLCGFTDQQLIESTVLSETELNIYSTFRFPTKAAEKTGTKSKPQFLLKHYVISGKLYTDVWQLDQYLVLYNKKSALPEKYQDKSSNDVF